MAKKKTSETKDPEQVVVQYTVPYDERLGCSGQVREAVVTRFWNPTRANLQVTFEKEDLSADHQDPDYADQHLIEVSLRPSVIFDASGAPGTFSRPGFELKIADGDTDPSWVELPA